MASARWGCARWADPPAASDDGSRPRVFAYDVVASYTHDSNAFTQGLAMCGTGVLCESTGAVFGMKSAVRATELRDRKGVVAGASGRRVRRRFSASWKRCARYLVANE